MKKYWVKQQECSHIYITSDFYYIQIKTFFYTYIYVSDHCYQIPEGHTVYTFNNSVTRDDTLLAQLQHLFLMLREMLHQRSVSEKKMHNFQQIPMQMIVLIKNIIFH